MSAEMSARAVSARLRGVAEATSLDARRRVHEKLDMTAIGVSRRLASVARMTALSLRLGRHGRHAERLEACRRLAHDLTALHRDQSALLREALPHTGRTLEALREVRAETRARAVGIVDALASHPQLLRQVVVRYTAALARDTAELGFPWTPALVALARDVVRQERPCLLVGPRSFPLETFAASAVRLPCGPDPTVVHASALGSDEAFGGAPLVVSGFLEVDQGFQRALCDRAVRSRTRLVALARCDTARADEPQWEGYVLPGLDAGVSDRLYKAAIPPRMDLDPATLRGWVLDPASWEDALLPVDALVPACSRS